jgi:pyruvate/2-oxoglutarate dehydrogenase complex dihydrolipoamide acyltransferase (E2) component
MIVPGQFQSAPQTISKTPSCILKSDVELFDMAPPAVRNLAVKHNLKLSQITGTGREGRIMK